MPQGLRALSERRKAEASSVALKSADCLSEAKSSFKREQSQTCLALPNVELSPKAISAL